MKNKGFAVLIAILVIAGMLITSIGVAFAEPYHVLSGRDKVGTYGKDGKSARAGFINEVMFEGSTSDTNETKLYALDPSSDNTIALPDSSGTLAISGASPVGATLTDAKALIGNSAGLAAEQSLSLINDVTGTMINSGVFNTTISADTITSEMIVIANVQASDMFINTVGASIAAGATGAAITVEPGSILLATHPVSGFSNDYTLTKSDYVGSTWFINTDAHPVAMVINGVFIRP